MRTLAFMLAVVCVSGCGGGKHPWDTVYPTVGTVVLNGRPLAGALITLVSEDTEVPESVRPTATSDDDGTFELGTFSKGDGAPAGNYKVVALHYPIVGSKESPSAGPNDLPSKYAKADTTDLRVEILPSSPDPIEIQLKK